MHIRTVQKHCRHNQEKAPKPRTGTRQRGKDVMQRAISVLTGQYSSEDRTEGYSQTGSTTGFNQIIVISQL